jgi:hypothetical protein
LDRARASSAGSPPGFPPLRPERLFVQHYSRRPQQQVPPAAQPQAPPTAQRQAPPAPLPKGAVAMPPVANQHGMATCAKSGFRMPAVLHAASLSLVSKTYRSVLADRNWRAAMVEEHSALL